MPAPSLSVNLPWQSLAANGQAMSGLGGDPAAAAAQLGGLYNQSYQSALGLNSSLFSGLQTGYDTLRSDVDQRYGDIQKGYSQLYGDVLGRISGTNDTNLHDINAAYNAKAGGSSQDLISRGLGNSSSQRSAQRGIELDRQRALTNSQNQFAQLGANYASQIGQAGLGAGERGTQTGAGLGQAQLGMLERVQAPYPSAQMYTNLAQMYGSNLQRQQDQRRADQLQSPGAGFSQASGFGVGTGAKDSGPFHGPTPGFGSGSMGGMTGGYGGGGFGSFGGSPAPYTPPSSWGFSGGNYGDGSSTGGWVPPSDVGYGDNPYFGGDYAGGFGGSGDYSGGNGLGYEYDSSYYG